MKSYGDAAKTICRILQLVKKVLTGLFCLRFPPSILKEFKMLLPKALRYQGFRRRFIQFEAGLAPSSSPAALLSDFNT